jgi:hypothetical protein
MMTKGICRCLVICCALLCGCSTQIGDGRTTQPVSDGGAEPDGKPSTQSVCTLGADGTCTSSDTEVLCCPQEGRPYDFANACYENTAETVYCYEQRGLSACGSPALYSCAATPDGSKAWYIANGPWQGMRNEGYVTCDEAGLSIYENGSPGNPDCP